MPEKCDIPKKQDDRTKVKPSDLSDDAHKEMVNAIWANNEKYTSNDLWPLVQDQLAERNWEAGRNKCLMFIRHWERNKLITNKKKGRTNSYSIV